MTDKRRLGNYPVVVTGLVIGKNDMTSCHDDDDCAATSQLRYQ